MPQQELNSSQELTVGGGGNTGGGSFTTGSKCPSSGTWVTENKYLRQVLPLAAGEPFPPDMTGKKCSWTALTTAIASSSRTADGGFTTVKVDPGTL
jgi:hypothetical protein